MIAWRNLKCKCDNKVFKNIKINIYTMDTDAKTMTSYEKKKPSIYKWRQNNKEKYNNLYVIKLKPYIMWKIKRKLANAKKSGMHEEKLKD